MSGPGPDAGAQRLVSVAGRVADRLRVVGPRLAARQGPAAAAVLDDVRVVLQQLADLAAEADGRARRPVPVLAAHALGDQVLVLAHDLVAADAGVRDDAVRVLQGLAARI